MSRIKALLLHDIRLQARYGIYPAYAFVIAFYIAMLHLIGEHLPDWLKILVLYTDPSVFGFFFLGALMMLEKSEDVRVALGMTPITPLEYFSAKAISLTLVALVAVVVLVPFLHVQNAASAHWLLLLGVLPLISVHYVGIGVPAALRFQTVTSYLIGAAGWLVPVIVPGFLAFGERTPAWALVIPSVSHISLLRVALGAKAATHTEVSAMLLVTLFSTIFGAWIGIRALRKEFGAKK